MLPPIGTDAFKIKRHLLRMLATSVRTYRPLFGYFGAFTFESVRSRDYDVILATTLIGAFFFIVMNLVTDLAYARIDPRVRLGAGNRT